MLNDISEKRSIKDLYAKMYRGMILKDRGILEAVPDSSFELVHMTGMKQSREVYICCIEDGTLNYYSEQTVNTAVTVYGDKAKFIGQSLVDAAVFGGGRHTWHLQQDIDLVKKNGKWLIVKSVASTF